jgi:predicted nuclease of predicted toxin-antitoxin system
MRFLANENFPAAAVLALHAKGNDVAWIRTEAPGSKDADVLVRAVLENRILVTFDKDFGELARRAVLPTTSGVILFRMPMPAAASAGAKLAARIEERDDWGGIFR